MQMSHKDNPLLTGKPMIIDLGDNDFVTVYGYNILTDDLEINYRYTGNKTNEHVEQILNSLIIKAFDQALENLEND